ncbi:LacI family DNA-binding transcriptional regulator [Anaerotalea alkaliphila]|uniref:LacI family DNA-binding transcriptional regulator n=1 Tax=Anaerotalea alkaliphila TaxID=2662126 RepID=A0A7X5HX86_9FIRM|nr:LacI family DNA-binding transcriptional regulator [Anaerotalea alkaliphila]NDL68337.1 LacI family DNA-binding transcriptional regulator [Anaerotalea alkaliphila]
MAKPSIKDVAREAGVSVTTVSRVFNNRGYIGRETREKVEEACGRLGYVRNELARSLLRKQTRIIGVVLPHISHYFFAELAQKIEEHLVDAGYKMMLCTTLGEKEKERAALEILAAQQVDGVIVGSHSLEADAYTGHGLPMVAFDRYLGEGIPCVGADHAMGGRLATEALIGAGCTRLAHLRVSRRFKSPVHNRSDAFEQVCVQRGIPHVVLEKKLNEFTEDAMMELYGSIVEAMPEVDGFFVSDTEAATLLQILHACGKQVPGQVQVVGYDGIALSRLTTPVLSTVAQPMDRIGFQLVRTLERVMAGEAPEQRLVLPVEWVQGGSTRS